MEKIVYQLNDKGYYMYPVKAYADPLNPGSFLIPRGCVEQQPPDVSPGNVAHWNGQWEEVAIPTSNPPDTPYVTFPDLEAAYMEGVQNT